MRPLIKFGRDPDCCCDFFPKVFCLHITYKHLHAGVAYDETVGVERIALFEYVEPYTVEPRPAVVYTAFCAMNYNNNK